jgi:glutamine cyclotransferase
MNWSLFKERSANIWHDQRIVTINPQSGAVTSWIDCTGLLSPGEATDEAVQTELHWMKAVDDFLLRVSCGPNCLR